jgi:hypothetical protein
MSLFLKQVDNFFHTEYHIKWNPIVKTIQTVQCIFLAGLVTYSFFHSSNHTWIIQYVPSNILIQCITDLFLTNKKDILFHHTCVIGFISIYQCGIFLHGSEIMTEIIRTEIQVKSILYLSSTELSTVFLMLFDYIPKEQRFIKTLNMYFFVSSFFYTRLYLVPFYLLLEPEYHRFVQSVPFSYSMVIYSGIYGLQLLNIYWGALILKKCFHLLIRKK